DDAESEQSPEAAAAPTLGRSAAHEGGQGELVLKDEQCEQARQTARAVQPGNAVTGHVDSREDQDRRAHDPDILSRHGSGGPAHLADIAPEVVGHARLTFPPAWRSSRPASSSSNSTVCTAEGGSPA